MHIIRCYNFETVYNNLVQYTEVILMIRSTDSSKMVMLCIHSIAIW